MGGTGKSEEGLGKNGRHREKSGGVKAEWEAQGKVRRG